MTGTDLKKVYNYSIYPRNSKVTKNKGFVNNDNGSMGGNHAACFYIKDKKSLYFDSFDGQSDNFLFQQVPKPITFHNYKSQDINSRLCGTYCLYFFYLIERMDYGKAVWNIYLGWTNASKCIW